MRPATRAIVALFLVTLGELLLLPFHLVAFLARRRRIRVEVRAALEGRDAPP